MSDNIIRLRVAKLRNGNKVRRTLYVQLGETPNDGDPLVGVVETPKLAFLICDALNEHLRQHPEAIQILAQAAWHSKNGPG